MIGCTKLSEDARALEFAAKENRIDYINANHAAVMRSYAHLTDEILRGTQKDGEVKVMEFMPEAQQSDDDNILVFTPEVNKNATE